MIGLDTNVLVRLLTGDNAVQRSIAKASINRNCSSEDPAFINRVVLIETVWVRESVYDYSCRVIAAAVDTLLRMVRMPTEGSNLVREALSAYRAGADFADALIAATNAAEKCSKTITFDRKAAKKKHAFFCNLTERCFGS